MSAPLVPKGKVQWTDENGFPLVGGTVQFCIPGTSTPKDTWEDAAQTTANPNPLTLDDRGEAVIFGTGTYRQIVYDALGNLIYDVLTYCGLDATAVSFDNATLDQIFLSRLNRVVDSVDALRALSKATYARAFATGYYAPHDDGGGAYQLDPGDTSSVDNGGTIIVAADGGRWKLQLTTPVSAKQFGAKGDGTAGENDGTDDTAALQRWLSALSPTLGGHLPSGVYNISATLIKVASSISITTDGAANSIINWIGAADTSDLITLGDGSTTCSFWEVGGIGFESAVKMTGGAALHVQKFMVRNYFEGAACGLITKNGNLFHGMWCDLINVFYLPNIDATHCQGDGLRYNGSSSDDTGSDLFLTRGNISFCGNGLHQGGGFGGVRTGQLNSFNNGVNYLWDTTIVARLNREIFYEPGSVCDGATVAGMIFDDALTSNAPVSLEGFIGSSGQLGGGAGPFHGIWIKNWPNGRIALKSAEVFNHLGDAIHKEDQSCLLTISPDTHLFNNGGWAVFASNPDVNIYYFGGYVANNTAGNFNANSQLANGDTFTPVVTADTGSLGAYTSTMRWSKAGKIATWTMFINITDVGTASGALEITLPFQTRLSVIAAGMDIAGSGKMLHGYIGSNASIQAVRNYDNTFPAQSGSVLVLSGSCEVE